MRRCYPFIALFLSLTACAPAEDATEKREARLKDMIARYNTFILGTVKAVGYREEGPDFTEEDYAVVVEIKEFLRGDGKAPTLWKIFIHSPTHEFGEYKTFDDLKGRRCIWAVTLKDGKLTEKRAPFIEQTFDDNDVELLRKLLKESDPAKKP